MSLSFFFLRSKFFNIIGSFKGTPSVCTLFCKGKNCCYSDGVAARLSSDACTGSLAEVVTDGT